MTYALPTPVIFTTSGGGGAGEDPHLFILPFSFGDATPALIGTVLSGRQILSVHIFITTAFNGTGAALSVGTSGTPTDLMTTSENDPATISEYSVYTQKVYGGDTGLYLHITPGSGASAGAGIAVIEYQS